MTTLLGDIVITERAYYDGVKYGWISFGSQEAPTYQEWLVRLQWTDNEPPKFSNYTKNLKTEILIKIK